ncbi:EAL domain-containing protein [Chitinibacter bivalviorum]|uniref:EAL domain-containing protein n=1 Tax=Chitinibacter bivalviorum TaxID=2739434 RepID=A0A7H9BLY7_9NEIS|nr:EAL domain-containing protein [Chitinibacter bivalviorum]QLG89452.1 EAL domain-containing protein [Chitinibacter bivalviorum]
MSILHSATNTRFPVPPEIARDWPESLFQIDSLRGILVKALGSTLASAFQPIVDRNGQRFADEALLRASVRDKAISPPQAFESARQGHKLIAFDRLCRTLHVMNYASYAPQNRLLFLNVHPELLVEISDHGAYFERILNSLGFSPNQVVLELLENDVSNVDASAISRAVKNYRAKGYRIALDDFGHGMANLDRLWLLEPDFVKLDRHILALAAQQDKARQGYGKLVSLLHDAGSQVIAEGVETLQEKTIALDSGVDALQGYFIATPDYRPV